MTSTHVDRAADEDTPRPLRKDAARNRAALVTAGRQVFAERGLDASLDDIARAAGVGVGTAYRHFANKFDLARAIFAEQVDVIVAQAEHALTRADAWSGLVAFLEDAAEAQSSDRGLREVMYGIHDDAMIEQVQGRLTGPLTQLVERAKAQGSVAEDVEASDFGVLMMMIGTVADVSSEVAPGLWRRYLPGLLAGLRPGQGPRRTVAALSIEDFNTAMRAHKNAICAPVRAD